MSLFDYIDWRGDLSFSQSGLNEVDNLILSMISYVDMDQIVPGVGENDSITLLAAARLYVRKHRLKDSYVGLLVPPEVVSLLAKAAKSRRFGGVRLCGYVNHVSDENQIQFSAMTYLLDDGRFYVAYRGTDDTIVGWKENFNMSFMFPVPAQEEALSYLETMAASREGELYVGGHSKGGNLAVYAAVCCRAALKDRIVGVYNNDGPGFNRAFVEGVDYLNMCSRIRTIVPQSSVVGMLLEHEESFEVVKSSQSGLLQHNGFTWELLGTRFIHLNTVNRESKLIDQSLKKWLSEMSAEERETFVESLYETISSTNAKTLTELNADKIKLVKAWNKLSPESRSVVRRCIGLLIKNSTFNLLIGKEKES